MSNGLIWVKKIENRNSSIFLLLPYRSGMHKMLLYHACTVADHAETLPRLTSASVEVITEAMAGGETNRLSRSVRVRTFKSGEEVGCRVVFVVDIDECLYDIITEYGSPRLSSSLEALRVLAECGVDGDDVDYLVDVGNILHKHLFVHLGEDNREILKGPLGFVEEELRELDEDYAGGAAGAPADRR